jgi:aryl-alcohol dehydrogenase-like predicted oxidoreductase
MKWFEQSARPRDIVAAAHDHRIGVMGIRALAARALTEGIDRDLPADNPVRADFRAAAPFRELARELGESPASLAHRYALSMPGVDTVVLGVKNRTELRECLATEAKGPPDTAVVQEIDARLSAAGGGDRRD